MKRFITFIQKLFGKNTKENPFKNFKYPILKK